MVTDRFLWYIIKENCEPILAGIPSKQLGIIAFQSRTEVFMPINIIRSADKQGLQEILKGYPNCFTRIGKLSDYQIKLHVEPRAKPVAEPPGRILYRLKERVDLAIKDMLKMMLLRSTLVKSQLLGIQHSDCPQKMIEV